ncbi:MAG: transketolase [Spirochaetota bacterium]
MNKEALEATALSVRSLSMDAVQAANSGHPGLPLGLAELGAVLYGAAMNHYPGDPSWPNRDRFVLSAGHGSMLLYSLLHLSGYKVGLDDLKQFRQVGSITPGHPEYGETEGVETTTGPLGQGISNAVGMALAEAKLASVFNTDTHKVVDHYTYVIASDGDMMEGVASEACSLAGHLALGKLIVFYDDNHISIEGDTALAFSEDVERRFQAYGWQTMSGDAYDIDGIISMIEKAKGDTERPTLIRLRSVIGKGSPNKAGTAAVHGAALGEDEVAASKREIGLDEKKQFFIDPRATEHFEKRRGELRKQYEAWQAAFDDWAAENPELKKEWDRYFDRSAPDVDALELPAFEKGEKVATRKASGKILQALAKAVPNLIGGSADLAPSNNSTLEDWGHFSAEDRLGRTLHFGVREHAMGAIASGIYLHGGFRPYAATFMVFSDYMRGSMRLAALMGIPVIYVMTHDSIYVGEDGPTHEPVEHYAALRAIPNMAFFRPGDAEETAEAWRAALERTDGPTVLALTRQGLPVYEKADPKWRENYRRGGYIVRDTEGTPDVVVVATGSEVSLALDAAEKSSRKVRVVSVLDRERFEAQKESFRSSMIPQGVRTVVTEVGVLQGWEGYVQSKDDLFGLNRFGASGKGAEVARHLGFTAEALASLIDR